ncbi:MAG TPA: DMT family transporter [Chitinophagaceae bacterium]|nr:DMT family transporter [Chitinophagaceae bacterium]
MQTTKSQDTILKGIGFAVLACLIWSGNFIIARGVINNIPPVTLSFYRWLTAAIFILPLAWKYLKNDFKIAFNNPWIILLASVTGISLFNTFIYIAGHYTTAINLALLGTCTSPVISVLLARIFLNEKITSLRLIGMLVCIAGILFLLGKGDFENLKYFRFTKGDWWVLAAAFAFAVYNISVRKKDKAMKPTGFLFITFLLGTLILLPFYIIEWQHQGGFELNLQNISAILFLGLGASVICFLIWNKSIHILGAGRTALFGNLIPVFSSIEAVLFLNEKITSVHLISFILVIAGLIIANFKTRKRV